MKRKRLLTVALTLLALAALLAVGMICAFSFAEGDSPETLIEAGVTEWRYKAMTHEQFGRTSSAWYQSYNAAEDWSSGTSPFGDRIDADHGSDRTGWSGDDHVFLLVTKFNISDPDAARQKDFVAHVWYDSNMTIYLNGEQVLVVQGHVDDYADLILDLSQALKRGDNLLAVSIEDNSGGREFDMTLTLQAHAAQQPGETSPVDPPVDPSLTVTESQLKSTGLSTLYINTDDGDYVMSRLEYKSGTMQIGLSDSDKGYTNSYTEAAGGVRIRGRGNSTWNNGYPDGKQNTLAGDTHTRKVPYNLKLSEKADLFGLGKSKKWVLISNYMDRTMMRNKLIYDLSGRMGMVYCKSVYVNLVLNGEYMGVYALTQKIEPGLFGGQVTDWEDLAEIFAEEAAKKYGYDESWQSTFEDQLCTDMSWLTEKTYRYKNRSYTVADFVDLSKISLYTGYLFEYDDYADEDSFFRTNNYVPLKVSNMEAIRTNPELFNYVWDFFNDFEEALYGENFTNDKGKHYTDYVDIDSMVDCFILNTVILNVEFGYKSMYMYINSDGKLVFGPCWDYDWSSGNPFLGANGQYNQWYNDWRAENNKWFRRLYADPYFVALVRERWAQLGDALDDMVDSMEYYYKLLERAEELEYAKFSSDPYESDFGWRTGGRSFRTECDQLKTFLQNRIEWLNTRFAKREPNIEGRGMSTDESLSLTLSGGSIASGNALADYSLTGSTASFTLTIRAAENCSAQIWVNGELKYKVNLLGGRETTRNLSGSDLLPGVNTITVYEYQGDTRVGANYLTVSRDGVKRSAPAGGSYTGGYTDSESKPPENQGGNPPESTTGKNPAATDPITSMETETTDAPGKTPTPTGGSTGLAPGSGDPSESQAGGIPIVAVMIGFIVIAAGGAVAGIVISKKRKN